MRAHRGREHASHGALEWRHDYASSYPSAQPWARAAVPDLTKQLAAVRIPTLLLWATRDALSPLGVAEELASKIHGARLVTIESDDHWVARTFAVDTAATIGAFVNATAVQKGRGRTLIPFYVMLVAIAIARAIGESAWPALDSWQAATRCGLAVMFMFTAVAHFDRTRADLVHMVPPQFPNPGLMVTLTGITELAGAVGLLIPITARLAAYTLILQLAAMFPANIYAATHGLQIRGRLATPLALRTPLQLLWIVLLFWCA